MEKLSNYGIFSIQDILNHKKLASTENGCNFRVNYPNGDHSSLAINTGIINIYEDNSLIIYRASDEIISMLYEDIQRLASQIAYYQVSYVNNNFSMPNIVITSVGKKHSFLSHSDIKSRYLVLVNEDTKINFIYFPNLINRFGFMCEYLPEKELPFDDILRSD